MASVDVPVALLGYGTVGASVNRLLQEQAEDIERATGHRLRVVKALVRNADKPREYPPDEGVLTTDVADVLDDPSIAIVAEVMGGVEPTGEYVLERSVAASTSSPPTSSSWRGAAPSSSRPPRPVACSCGSRPACARRSR